MEIVHQVRIFAERRRSESGMPCLMMARISSSGTQDNIALPATVQCEWKRPPAGVRAVMTESRQSTRLRHMMLPAPGTAMLTVSFCGATV